MKKLLAVLALTIPLMAHAQNWAMLVETDTERVLVDLYSVDLVEYQLDKNTKSWLMKADMAIAETGELLRVAIDAQECILKESGLLAVYMPADDSKHQRFWTPSGSKVYDKQGQFLCTMTKLLVERNKKESKAKKIPV